MVGLDDLQGLFQPTTMILGRMSGQNVWAEPSEKLPLPSPEAQVKVSTRRTRVATRVRGHPFGKRCCLQHERRRAMDQLLAEVGSAPYSPPSAQDTHAFNKLAPLQLALFRPAAPFFVATSAERRRFLTGSGASSTLPQDAEHALFGAGLNQAEPRNSECKATKAAFQSR